MLRPFAAILILAVFAAPVRGADDGFADLFDGVSLAGWTQRGGKAIYTIDAKAEGGPQIVGTSVKGTPNSFLCTERDYTDFVLEFEVQVDPVLNSGVQFRSNCYDKACTMTLVDGSGGTYTKHCAAGVVHGYQAEIDPTPRAFSGGIYDESRRGWLLKPEGSAYAAARAAFDPAGWNRYRIEARGDSIKTFINGVAVADLQDDLTATGFIALQVHAVGTPEQVGKQVRWRNLRLKELATAE
ncbi:3-keto-disaccharide hydrolase [Botrimarina hoheduenensis]|uniref:3-keto-alpha-glucoside-1,2-lyase/3-keto-2-hydroxy-glucal hydratase domain-containing protein n=1 Tax=Botrimarina hoheduenensis TaxID=2528000 RepID=A0A5C5WAX5_9BACT|nr:DUF1080 domain-containing protein [Botrimarina hoheduenensis]TWT47229.1 hypothetical protein Pla111_08410 [Botrimarina hoheduenensis]